MLTACSNPENSKALILGNRFNAHSDSGSVRHVRTVWLPFCSLSFAERFSHTPLDLLQRDTLRIKDMVPDKRYASMDLLLELLLELLLTLLLLLLYVCIT